MDRRSIAIICVAMNLPGCSTQFIEFHGSCVLQEWRFIGQVIRDRALCSLPPPSDGEQPLRERDAMDINPFPDLFDYRNNADSVDPNLLEKYKGVPQDDSSGVGIDDGM